MNTSYLGYGYNVGDFKPHTLCTHMLGILTVKSQYE